MTEKLEIKIADVRNNKLVDNEKDYLGNFATTVISNVDVLKDGEEISVTGFYDSNYQRRFQQEFLKRLQDGDTQNRKFYLISNEEELNYTIKRLK